MITHFDQSRWARIGAAYESWWKNELDRPVFNVVIHGVPTSAKRPENFCSTRFSNYPFHVPVETILENIHYDLCTKHYLGDGYPMYLPDYGSGVNAAFVGGQAEVRRESVWFFPSAPCSVSELKLEHKPDNPVYKRICEFYEKADAYFKGSIVLGITHLNNGIDIPAHLLDSTELLMALYDEPEEVERLIMENHHLFLFYMKDLSSRMVHNPGYSCWSGLFARKPCRSLQSDFSAMISPEHFRQLILPELKLCVEKNPEYSFYHLDGRGELPHLDMILDIEKLQCIQWANDDFTTKPRDWLWLYKKFYDAGKKIWFSNYSKFDLEDLDRLADTLGTLKGVYCNINLPYAEEEAVLRTLEKFGAL